MKNTDDTSKNALFKLAFFEPNLSDDSDNQVIDYLILDCISGYGSLLDCDSHDISTYLKTTFLIEFEEAEIIKGAERLAKKRQISIIKDEHSYESPRFKLLKSDASDQIQNLKEIQSLEDLVFSEWSDILRDKYKNILNQDKANRIIESFKIFLTKMFVRHGKESVSILYPEIEKTQEWISSIQEEIIRDLPRLDKELDLILQIEIPIFFKANSVHRKKYLNNLFNASFLWHLIQVDESCTQYFKQTTKGQILVLDANILFSLIGLHGPQVLASIHNLLTYANKLEYLIFVSTKTLDEFYESIQRNSERAYESPSYTKNIAKAAIDTLDSNSFLVAYWKEFINQGLTIEEFAIEKAHIKVILENLKISIINDFREEIEKSQELLDEESILRSACGGDIAPTIIEHDAFHCILINKLRKGPKYKYSDATAWFLTHDTKLPVYAHIGLKGKKSLPFCITTNEWIQINRPFLKRTQDANEFEQSFQILVTQPYLRSLLTNFKVDKLRERLFLRLNRYNNMSTQLAFEMAADVHFLSTLSRSPNEKDFNDKIDSVIVDINKSLKAENKELYIVIEQQSRESNDEISSLKETIGEIKEELSAKDETMDSLKGELKKLRKEIADSENGRSSNKAEADNVKKEYKQFKKKIRWILFTIIFIITIVPIWVSGILIESNWYLSLKNKVVLKILLSMILLFSLLNIPVPKNWKIWLPILACFLIAFLTILTIN
jgi:hypothetical protein